MGGLMSCISEVSDVERQVYDMRPLQCKNLPIVWLIGQQNTGKKTHGNFIKETFNFEHISVTELLRSEALNDTERGKSIHDLLESKKKIPDAIVLDLIKEALLTSSNENGFVISNFPKNAKQAEMFVKEVGNVTFIVYLYTNTPLLINRAHEKAGGELNDDTLKRDIAYATRDIKTSISKFSVKVENINTNGLPEEVFQFIENCFTRRLNLDRPMVIISETDYITNQEEEEI